VPPAELEGLSQNHPKVYDVAVIGIYEAEKATEVPRAYIVTAPGVTRGQETEGEITHW
jgi:4-coumarate--CoA ligase